ncbi:MAG: hypothetical protein KBG00_06990 [Rhodoferax sp.]|nr:hypothetical protein [Rhodoferax sp.]MBP9736213.1 hypothetical protein [Rhodoferax sp.]
MSDFQRPLRPIIQRSSPLNPPRCLIGISYENVEQPLTPMHKQLDRTEITHAQKVTVAENSSGKRLLAVHLSSSLGMQQLANAVISQLWT